jgi:hypothetical protein
MIETTEPQSENRNIFERGMDKITAAVLRRPDVAKIHQQLAEQAANDTQLKVDFDFLSQKASRAEFLDGVIGTQIPFFSQGEFAKSIYHELDKRSSNGIGAGRLDEVSKLFLPAFLLKVQADELVIFSAAEVASAKKALADFIAQNSKDLKRLELIK